MKVKKNSAEQFFARQFSGWLLLLSAKQSSRQVQTTENKHANWCAVYHCLQMTKQITLENVTCTKGSFRSTVHNECKVFMFGDLLFECCNLTWERVISVSFQNKSCLLFVHVSTAIQNVEKTGLFFPGELKQSK